MNAYLMEMIGTFFLVAVIALTGDPVAIAAVLAAMIYIGAHISGGQYNPAVSVALSAIGKQSWDKTMYYVSAQLVGGVLGVFVSVLLAGKTLTVAPAAGVALSTAIIGEAIFTFALVSAVFHTAVSSRASGSQYYGLAIALTVMAGAKSVGAITGGAFNPAVGLAPLLYATAQGKSIMLEHVIIYFVGPILGGVLAARFYLMTLRHRDAQK